jgi:hypothetical protein
MSRQKMRAYFTVFPSAATLAVGFALLAGSLSPATACAFHGGLATNVAAIHPGALDLMAALDANAGSIEVQAAPPASMVAYHRMVKQIEQFRDLLEGAGKRQAPIFSLVLVDAALWSRLAPAPSGLALSLHTAGPDRGEAVVLTASAVIRAILAGGLSPGEALTRGVIRVEAEIDQKLALFDLLGATPSDRPAGAVEQR